MNTGCYFAPSMGFSAVHVIGMITSMQSYGPLVSPHRLQILVFTLALFKIRRTRLPHNHYAHSHLVSTLMTSSISPKTLLPKPSSVVCWPNSAKWISWGLSIGSLASISLGALPCHRLPFTSINPVLHLIWLRASSVNRVILPLRLHHIGLAFLLIPLLHLRTTTILLLKFNGKRLTKVCSAALVGLLVPLASGDLFAVHSFLLLYSNKPATGHMKTALYALHYIHSTHDYGISCTSEDVAPMHSYVHYSPLTNIEAYKDAILPTLTNSSTLSAYSDACWGLQIGSVVTDGTLLPLSSFVV
jgi:hypothetical protein